MLKKILVGFLLVCMMPESGQAREPLTDHALVAPYDGSRIRRKDVKEFIEYNAFTGMDNAGKQPTGIALEGKVTRLFYDKPRDRSILEVFRNYEAAIAQAGAEILYTCNQEKMECARRYAGPVLQKYSGIHAISNLKGRYLLAKMHTGEQTAYIAIAVGEQFTDIHIVEIRGMDAGLVKLDATALGKGLDVHGYVIVEGIYFDTDKATLKPESEAALTEMAKLLEMRPDLNVYVVGHTDMQGSLEHNRSLSDKRARAVIDALVYSHGVSRERMEGFGVGPLAPHASNRDEGGRSKNRRVVLVAR